MTDGDKGNLTQEFVPPVDFYEQIFSSFHTGIIVVDQDDRITVSNPAAYEHLEAKADFLVPGTPLAALSKVAPFSDVLDELKNTKQPVLRREIELLKNSDPQLIGVSASMLQGKDEYSGAIFVFTNLTSTRSKEQAAAINRQLAEIGKLTGGVVHELRNPLSVISGMAELMKRKLDESHELRSFADMIFEEAQGMEKLVAKFLSFAKPFEMDFSDCNPVSIIEAAKAANKNSIEQKNISMNCDTDEVENIIFRADCEMASQALGNLLSNAIEAVEADSTVNLSCTLKDYDVCFRVTDNGKGISELDRESLANPFYSRKADGTGLGLSITNRIITAHGGNLNYGNREKGGAWFEITFPAESTFDLLTENTDSSDI